MAVLILFLEVIFPTCQSNVNQCLNKLITPYSNTELGISEAKGMASDTQVHPSLVVEIC